MSYTIEQISDILKAERLGSVSANINWLLTDSRSLSFPEDTLFFALDSSRDSGTKYIRTLYNRGVRNFVIAKNHKDTLQLIYDDLEYKEGTNFLIVEDTLKALQHLAAHHRSEFQYPVVGITGSNGKTVVKEWLHQILSSFRKTVRSPRSYNSQIGVPLSVWQMNEDSEVAIFEAGVSQPEEMETLAKILKPTIGVLTNIGGAHQENFYSIQEKCLEKLKLFKNCDVIIYEADDLLISNCISQSMLPSREIAWSRRDVERPLYISSVKKEDDKTTISYRYLGLENSYIIPFIDDASIQNSINCLAVCLYLMISPEDICSRMALLEPIAMRLEVKQGKENTLIINDSYSSDLASLDIALDFHYRRSMKQGLKRTLILSDLVGTGQNAITLYRKVSQLIFNKQIQRIIGVGKLISREQNRFNIEKTFFETTEELVEAIKQNEISFENESILLKGARDFCFENVLELLELKRHETILEINLSILVENLNYYRNLLKPETKIMCMVKASAYGAGACEVAKTLQDYKVDYLGVAVADEGVELRKAGISNSIIIMNPEQSAFKLLFEYNLEPEVYSFDLLNQLIREAEKEGVTNFPIHIKVDTGMHRLGFMPYEMEQVVEILKHQNALIPKSVFSHFAGSDSNEFDSLTKEQLELFKTAADCLQSAFQHKIIKHICNSAAIARFPEAHFDMVRLGLGLYGVDPCGTYRMKAVSTLKTSILQIKNLHPGDTVGYSRKGKIVRESRTAAIPIGYADGLNRKLGNLRGYCIVNGQKAPYIGNICMDVSMIDVTDIDCKEGDEVIIFGDELPTSILADILDTIPYEVMSNVSTRVKRVYYQD